MRRIIPSITTHGHGTNTWQEKIQEIQTLGLRQVALFTTGLSIEDRFRCYEMLEATRKRHMFTIPFVHAVSSMTEDEYQYLTYLFKTEFFNLHPLWEFPLQHELSAEVRKRILIENSGKIPLCADDIIQFGGICFDLSHLEDSRLADPAAYDRLIGLTASCKVHANHISAVKAFPTEGSGLHQQHSAHLASSHNDMNYLYEISPLGFSELCAIELENSLEQQCAFIPAIRTAMEENEAGLAKKIAA